MLSTGQFRTLAMFYILTVLQSCTASCWVVHALIVDQKLQYTCAKLQSIFVLFCSCYPQILPTLSTQNCKAPQMATARGLGIWQVNTAEQCNQAEIQIQIQMQIQI